MVSYYPLLFTKQWYVTYLIKRVLRIYVPYIVSTIVFCGLFFLIKPTISLGLSDFVDRNLYKNIQFRDIIGHLFLIGNYNAKSINPVKWSLIHEMRISIIFPLIMFLVVKLKAKTVICLSILIVFIAQGIMFVFGYTGESGIIYTFYFIPIFIIGALLDKHLEEITSYIKELRTSTKFILFIVGILLYT